MCPFIHARVDGIVNDTHGSRTWIVFKDPMLDFEILEYPPLICSLSIPPRVRQVAAWIGLGSGAWMTASGSIRTSV